MVNTTSSGNNVYPFSPPCKPTAKFPYLLVNANSEPWMPVRLYYNDVNPYRITGHFGIIDCISKVGKYWHVYYRDELAQFINEYTKEEFWPNEPTLFARIRVDYKQRQMIIDTDSYHSAIIVAKFLNDYLPKDGINLQCAATYNRYVYTKSNNYFVKFIDYTNYDLLFENSNLVVEIVAYKEQPLKKQEKLYFFPLIDKFILGCDNNPLHLLATNLKLKLNAAENISIGKINPNKAINVNG